MKVQNKEGYWGRFAESYEKDGEYVVGKPILNAIQGKLLQEKALGKTVEFGCGTGYFTKAAAGNAAHVVATDLSDKMVEAAQIRLAGYGNVTVQKADCSGTSFPEGGFDSVIMINLIHVLKNPLPCLQESHRILRKGGLLIAADLTGWHLGLQKKISLGFRYMKKWGLPPRGGKDNMSPDEIIDIFRKSGFKVMDSQLLAGGANALYVKGEKP
jgi:SAM-dependent methyltransferase